MSNGDLASLFDGNPFDPYTLEPTTDFPIIPPGKYPVLIEAAEVKQTKAGTGHYLKLTMSILDGDFKNQKIWDQINLQNPSVQCTEIGMRTLSALGRALGLQTITDTTQLTNKVVVAHVKVKGDQNQVRTYSASGPVSTQPESTYQSPVSGQPTQQTDKREAQSKPPWVK